MSDEAYRLDTAGARVAVVIWRTGAEWMEATVRSLVTRCHALDLDAPRTGLAGLLPENARQLRLAADLLERVAAEVAAVGFDMSSTELPDSLVAPYLALRRSLDDPIGRRPLDLPDPRGVRGTHATLHFGDLPLWAPDGPSPDDVHQGGIGDCGLMAVLAALAATDPARIERMLTDHGDGTYTVRIGGDEIAVDDEFLISVANDPFHARGPGRGQAEVLWPLLVEKALAVADGNDYHHLEGRDPVWAHELFGSTDEMSISQWLWPDPADAHVLATITTSLATGRMITATSGDTFGMSGVHTWAVVAAGQSADGSPTVTVHNPWGRSGFEVVDGEVVNSHGVAIPHVDAGEVVVDEEHAELTVPLEVFVDQFDELDYVTEWE